MMEPTPKELEVLKLICKGYTMFEVATLLNKSVKTVETQVAALHMKGGFQDRGVNRILLFIWAIENGHAEAPKRRC